MRLEDRLSVFAPLARAALTMSSRIDAKGQSQAQLAIFASWIPMLSYGLPVSLDEQRGYEGEEPH